MYVSRGFRVDPTRQQTRLVDILRSAQRYAYNWAVERLKADPILTYYSLQKEFRAARRPTPYLRDVPVEYQMTAIRRARTAADRSNKYGRGNLRFRSAKRDGLSAVECDAAPKYTDNKSVNLPGLGETLLSEEQPYLWLFNWLYGARSFRFVDVTPRSWARVKPGDRVYRLQIIYRLDDPGP